MQILLKTCVPSQLLLINPVCSCGFEPETIDHYFLLYKLYNDLRLDFLNTIQIKYYDIYTINLSSLKNLSKDQLVNDPLFVSENFALDTNANILRRTIEFLKATERINSLLF